MPDSTKHHLLIVEDDPSSLALLCAYLQHPQFVLETAGDGEAALELIQQKGPDYFSAFLLDYRMPKKDGLTLLKELKNLTDFEMTPVIMQTSADKYEEITQGIQAGAFYYLLKPYTKEHLLSVVDAAVNGFINHQRLIHNPFMSTDTTRLLKQAHFSVKTFDQARHLAQLLANLAPNPDKLVIGLFELMANAIEHGNLNIGYQEKTELIKSDQWQTEIARRLDLPENQKKKVDIDIVRTGQQLEFHITDMGQGFDPSPFMDFTPERAMDNHGRGILMAQQFSFDTLQFEDQGRHVIGTLNMPSHPDFIEF